MSRISAQDRPTDRAGAEAWHAERREIIGRVAAEQIRDIFGINLQFRVITERDAEEADKWVKDTSAGPFVPGWLWTKELKRARRKPRRIEAAIYTIGGARPALCGLLLGRISRGHLVASIHFLARAPMAGEVRGVFGHIAYRYLVLCAEAFGCERISISRPVKPLVGFYKELGFTHEVVKKGKIERLEATEWPQISGEVP